MVFTFFIIFTTILIENVDFASKTKCSKYLTFKNNNNKTKRCFSSIYKSNPFEQDSRISIRTKFVSKSTNACGLMIKVVQPNTKVNTICLSTFEIPGLCSFRLCRYFFNLLLTVILD